MHIIKRFIGYSFTLIVLLQSPAIATTQPNESPSASTSTKTEQILVISDFEMQQCKDLYNKAEQEFSNLLNMLLDPDDPESVKKMLNQYNIHNELVTRFNNTCAGKQSQSSCENIKKKRTEQGLSYQDCNISGSE